MYPVKFVCVRVHVKEYKARNIYYVAKCNDIIILYMIERVDVGLLSYQIWWL